MNALWVWTLTPCFKVHCLDLLLSFNHGYLCHQEKKMEQVQKSIRFVPLIVEVSYPGRLDATANTDAKN